jgi:colanic acid/amylovoran biosynthesis protein
MRSNPIIAIIGGTIWGNRGAEAMLVTTIGMIRREIPQAQFLIYSYYPSRDCQLVSDPSIKLYDARPLTLALKYFPLALIASLLQIIGIRIPLPEALSKLRKANVLLDIGGITFADGRAVFLLFNTFTILPAILLRVPVIKLSQAMGPFRTTLNRILAGYFLRRCEHIFARGAITAAHLQDLGLENQKWTQAADIAMLYESAFSLSTENKEKVQDLMQKLDNVKKEGKNIIALSPSTLVMKKSQKADNRYTDIFLNLIKQYGEKDTHFVFLPNASREGTIKARNNDILVIQEIRRISQGYLEENLQEVVEWVDYDINSAAVRAIIDQADLLLTSRFHAMIAGLALCTPAAVIGWSHKYRETLADFSIEELSIDYSSQDTNLEVILDTLLKTRFEYADQIRSHLVQVRKSSRVQFDYVKEFLTCVKN